MRWGFLTGTGGFAGGGALIGGGDVDRGTTSCDREDGETITRSRVVVFFLGLFRGPGGDYEVHDGFLFQA